MTDLTDQQIEALDAAATPGPWGVFAGPTERPEDAAFIAAARSLVPSLLARAQKAEADADDLRSELAEGGQEWSRMASQHYSLIGERDALAARLASAEAKLPTLDRLFDAIYQVMHGDRFVGALEREAVAQLAEGVAAALAADTTPEPTEPTKRQVQLLREVAERDPEAHGRALARGYGVGSATESLT